MEPNRGDARPVLLPLEFLITTGYMVSKCQARKLCGFALTSGCKALVWRGEEPSSFQSWLDDVPDDGGGKSMCRAAVRRRYAAVTGPPPRRRGIKFDNEPSNLVQQ